MRHSARPWLACSSCNSPPFTPRALLYASDGMRPDLMERYAAQGAMPTYAGLLRAGVRGDNGLVQGFPPNTGVGWYTLATGTWPGEHGSTNNTFHQVGEGSFNNRTSFSATGVLQADTIANAAERAGKKVAQASAAAFGLSYQVTGFTAASGWTNVPAGPRRTVQTDGADRADDLRLAEPDPRLRRVPL